MLSAPLSSESLSPDIARTWQAADNLRKTFWGNGLDVKLHKVLDDNGNSCKYLPMAYYDDLRQLGHCERVLLIRKEYDSAFERLQDWYSTARDHNCGGVVVTGQPGNGMLSLLTIALLIIANQGKSCFLYYLLLYLLSKEKPVALQLSSHFLVFQGTHVNIYPNELANPYVIPIGAWALSDSSYRAKQPCNTFLDAAKQQFAWIVHTTSPLERRWKEWEKQHSVDMFVMDHFSIGEITALGSV